MRVHAMDELRGVAICGMILHHTFYDVTVLWGIGSTILYSTAGRLAQLLIAGTFLLLAGISSQFSRNNTKRGLICLGAGGLLTLITTVFVPEQMILFGVLHFLGVAILLHRLLSYRLNKMNQKILFVIFTILFVITRTMLPSFALPTALYQTPIAFLLFVIGIYDPAMGIHSADYFPLIPWFFLFLAGTTLGEALKNGRAPDFFYRPHLPLFARIGKHSLLIYLVHQPIVYGLVLFLSRFVSAS